MDFFFEKLKNIRWSWYQEIRIWCMLTISRNIYTIGRLTQNKFTRDSISTYIALSAKVKPIHVWYPCQKKKCRYFAQACTFHSTGHKWADNETTCARETLSATEQGGTWMGGPGEYALGATERTCETEQSGLPRSVLISLHQKHTWWRHQMETSPRYWPFVRGIHRWPVNSPHKGQWRGALMFPLICALNKRLGKQS